MHPNPTEQHTDLHWSWPRHTVVISPEPYPSDPAEGYDRDAAIDDALDTYRQFLGACDADMAVIVGTTWVEGADGVELGLVAHVHPDVGLGGDA